jgi:formiminoglutamase
LSGKKYMKNKNYETTSKRIWDGRVDSVDNFYAFRWHQWISLCDLEEDKFPSNLQGIGFIGFCSDEGVRKNLGRTGTANGPDTIREQLSNLPCYFTRDFKLYDFGNIYCHDMELEDCQKLLAEGVEKILNTGLYPVVLGGGHDVAFGHYCGLFNHYGDVVKDPGIGIINFDAHLDMRPYPKGSSSGTMFRQIGDMVKERDFDFNYLCLGVQKRGNTIDLFRTAREYGANYIYARDLLDMDMWKLMEEIDSFVHRSKMIYMTICSDVFSSGFAPGVSAAQPLGLEPEKVIKIMKYVIKSGKNVSFDIAEVSPRFDQDHITARLASTLVFAVVNAIAELKGMDAGV